MIDALNETEQIAVLYVTEDSKYVTSFTSATHILFYDKMYVSGVKMSECDAFMYFQYTVWVNPTMALSMNLVKLTNDEFKQEHQMRISLYYIMI